MTRLITIRWTFLCSGSSRSAKIVCRLKCDLKKCAVIFCDHLLKNLWCIRHIGIFDRWLKCVLQRCVVSFFLWGHSHITYFTCMIYRPVPNEPGMSTMILSSFQFHWANLTRKFQFGSRFKRPKSWCLYYTCHIVLRFSCIFFFIPLAIISKSKLVLLHFCSCKLNTHTSLLIMRNLQFFHCENVGWYSIALSWKTVLFLVKFD